jgi:hypothetical protein
MSSLRNDVNNLFDNTHVRIKLYWEFSHMRIVEQIINIIPK